MVSQEPLTLLRRWQVLSLRHARQRHGTICLLPSEWNALPHRQLLMVPWDVTGQMTSVLVTSMVTAIMNWCWNGCLTISRTMATTAILHLVSLMHIAWMAPDYGVSTLDWTSVQATTIHSSLSMTLTVTARLRWYARRLLVLLTAMVSMCQRQVQRLLSRVSITRQRT